MHLHLISVFKIEPSAFDKLGKLVIYLYSIKGKLPGWPFNCKNRVSRT